MDKTMSKLLVEIDLEDEVSFNSWLQNRKEQKKKIREWWLSKEGREEIRYIWDNPEKDLPLILLNEIERLESFLVFDE